MWKVAKFQLKSECPLILHNGELANPLNPLVKQMKKVSGKRIKTDADFKQLGKFEFMGGLYLDEKLGVILPSDMIEAALIGGAKKFTEGTSAKQGMYVANHHKLIFDGPQEPEKMWKDGRFTFQKMVKVKQSRILRTRPIFNEWSAEVEVLYEPSNVDLSQLAKWFVPAGKIIGIGDWRPRYGRFEVKALD